jgi:DNA-directed RNA polymerase specialized sigma24 family protein
MLKADAERDLQAAKRRVDNARHNLQRAMQEARAAGMTYREIAAIVGLAHETVRRMLAD